MRIEEGAVVVAHIASELLEFGDTERMIRLKMYLFDIVILLCQRDDIGKMLLEIVAAGDDRTAQDDVLAECRQKIEAIQNRLQRNAGQRFMDISAPDSFVRSSTAIFLHVEGMMLKKDWVSNGR